MGCEKRKGRVADPGKRLQREKTVWACVTPAVMATLGGLGST